MYNMPSTPLTCCSIGVATICAIVVALAPGYCASTTTVGGVIVGYCSTGRDFSETSPATTISIDRTVANIGRFMKNLDNIVLLIFDLLFMVLSLFAILDSAMFKTSVGTFGI